MAFGTKKAVAVETPRLQLEFMEVVVVGDTRVVTHNWSEKARRQMLEKQMGKARVKKEPRDPDADFKSSLYPLPDGGFGLPSIAFKKAMVSACRSVDGFSMTAAKQAFHVLGDFVKIEGVAPVKREDMVRNDDGGADIRFRGEFTIGWWCKLPIRYNASVTNPSWLLLLLNSAGFGVGVGENRSEKSGNTWGSFHVASEEEVKALGAGIARTKLPLEGRRTRGQQDQRGSGRAAAR